MPAKILIVDDEESLVQFLQKALGLEFPGAAVDTAFSGEEGLSRLAAGPYDLIICDYRMPGFDGLELIQGVRYLDPRAAIILMTGYGSDAVLREARQLGVQRYLPKPFEVDDLMQAVSKLLPAGKREGNA